jgi:hypothetical protein
MYFSLSVLVFIEEYRHVHFIIINCMAVTILRQMRQIPHTEIDDFLGEFFLWARTGLRLKREKDDV